MPNFWRESYLGPIYKCKGNGQDFKNYGYIKLIIYTIKVCKNFLERG